jgi:hypothetical protein
MAAMVVDARFTDLLWRSDLVCHSGSGWAACDSRQKKGKRNQLPGHGRFLLGYAVYGCHIEMRGSVARS